MQALGAGAVGTLLASNTATAAGDARPAAQSQGNGNGSGNGGSIDPIFGLPMATPNPCGGDAGEDCFEEFPASRRPDHEVEMHIDLPGFVFALVGQGGLSVTTTNSINDAIADGEVDSGELHKPNQAITVQTPNGEAMATILQIARMLLDTHAFHFEPAGIQVEPGDVILFSAETPDHAVAAFHERHGRQNRVPDGVGPIASPLVPVGGSWRYRFEQPGVYDLYCPPHGVFGMVMRVVVHEDGPVPSLSVEQTGRPPEEENLLGEILGGFDPMIPSEAAALESDVLDPENVVENGPIEWEAVVEEYRSG